jgi:hypothetical protein
MDNTTHVSPEIMTLLEKYAPQLARLASDAGQQLTPDDIMEFMAAPPATSTQAWREKLTRTLDFEDGLAIKFRLINMLALIDSDGETPNPLLSIVAQHMNGKQEAIGKKLMEDPTALHSLRVMLKDIMVKVVVEPPLVEQGHPDGIHVDDISMEKQMAVFESLMGGTGLAAAQSFRPQPTSPVVSS